MIETADVVVVSGRRWSAAVRSVMPAAHIPSVLKAMRDGDPYRVRAFLVWTDGPHSMEIPDERLLAALTGA